VSQGGSPGCAPHPRQPDQVKLLGRHHHSPAASCCPPTADLKVMERDTCRLPKAPQREDAMLKSCCGPCTGKCAASESR
jgi:hypothetical protein